MRRLLALILLCSLAACGVEGRIQAQQQEFLVLDVRTMAEYEQGHLDGAYLLPYDRIDQPHMDSVYRYCDGLAMRSFGPHKEAPILVYCRSGRRSAIAQQTLQELGYTNVVDGGGYQALLGQDLQEVHGSTAP